MRIDKKGFGKFKNGFLQIRELLLIASKRHTLNNPARNVGIISNIETASRRDALSKENF